MEKTIIKNGINKSYIEAFNTDASRALLIKSKEGRPFQHFVQAESMFEYFELHIHGELDTYLSPNGFGKYTRVKTSISRLKAFFLDLDTEKNGYSKASVLSVLSEIIDEGGLFPPSYVVDSGHGLYLLWNLETRLVFKSPILNLWQKVENEIADRFDKAFQTIFNTEVSIVDHSSTDPGRVLRIPGTYNHKRDNKVRCEVVGGNEELYVLFDVADELLPMSHEQYVRTVQQKTSHKRSKTLIQYHFSAFESKLLWQRIQDFKTLVEVRNGNMNGSRELLLFLVANTVGQLVSQEQLERMVDEFNAYYSEPLPENEVNTIKAEMVGLAKKKSWYRYKNVTIVKQLQVTNDEAKHMAMLLTPAEKKARRAKHTVTTNQERAKRRKNARQERTSKIKSMYTKGMTQQEIATKLEVSRDTIIRELKK